MNKQNKNNKNKIKIKKQINKEEKEKKIIFNISKNTKHKSSTIETNMMFFLKKVTYFQYFAIFCCTG